MYPTLRCLVRAHLDRAAAHIVERLGGEPASVVASAEASTEAHIALLRERALAEQRRAQEATSKLASFESANAAQQLRLKELGEELTAARADAKAELAQLKAASQAAMETSAEPAGEPVAWRANYPDGRWMFAHVKRHAEEAVQHSGATDFTPLYEAPPPAAIGVTDELFACLGRASAIEVDGAIRRPSRDVLMWLDDGERVSIGSRDLAEARRVEGLAEHQKHDAPLSVVRLVPADAPAVDLQLLRKMAVSFARTGRAFDAGAMLVATGDYDGQGEHVADALKRVRVLVGEPTEG